MKHGDFPSFFHLRCFSPSEEKSTEENGDGALFLFGVFDGHGRLGHDASVLAATRMPLGRNQRWPSGETMGVLPKMEWFPMGFTMILAMVIIGIIIAI